MFWFGTGFVQHGNNIFQSLSDLASKVIGLELALRVPPDHSGNTHRFPAGHHPVGVTAGPGPCGGL
jgi:hypothetical protein